MVLDTRGFVVVRTSTNRLIAFSKIGRVFVLIPEHEITIRGRAELKAFMLTTFEQDTIPQAAQHHAGGQGFDPYQAQQGYPSPMRQREDQWGSPYSPAMNQQGRWGSPYPPAVNQQGWDTHHQPQQPVNTQQQRLLPPPSSPRDVVGQSQDDNAHAVVRAPPQEIVPAHTAYAKKEDNKLLYVVLAFMLVVLLMFAGLVVHCTNGMVSLRGETIQEFTRVDTAIKTNEAEITSLWDRVTNIGNKVAENSEQFTMLEGVLAGQIEQNNYARVGRRYVNNQIRKNKDSDMPAQNVGSSALALIDGNKKKPENDMPPVYVSAPAEPIYDGQTRAGSSGNVFDKIAYWFGIASMLLVGIALYGQVLPPPERQRATTRAPRNRGDGHAIVARRRDRQD